jgi:hypothetical protein
VWLSVNACSSAPTATATALLSSLAATPPTAAAAGTSSTSGKQKPSAGPDRSGTAAAKLLLLLVVVVEAAMTGIALPLRWLLRAEARSEAGGKSPLPPCKNKVTPQKHQFVKL